MNFTGVPAFCLFFNKGQTDLNHLKVMKFRDSTLIKAVKFQGKVQTTFRMELGQLMKGLWWCVIAGDGNHYSNRSPSLPSLPSNLTAETCLFLLQND